MAKFGNGHIPQPTFAHRQLHKRQVDTKEFLETIDIFSAVKLFSLYLGPSNPILINFELNYRSIDAHIFKKVLAPWYTKLAVDHK
jgi:hypothetical protein